MNISRNILFSAALRFSVAVSFLLLAFRVFATGMDGYFFLLWNLFLAAVPYALSLFFESAVRKTPAILPQAIVIFFLWFFFFPNAPYIATDFIHLPWEYVATLRFAYDFVLIGMFAFSGLLFGLASLFRVHRALRKVLGKFRADMMVVLVLSLSGIGMYLGRFLRWNSWDMFLNPAEVLRDTFSHYGDPVWFARAVFLSMLFSVFTAISYTIFAGLYRFLGKRAENSE